MSKELMLFKLISGEEVLSVAEREIVSTPRGDMIGFNLEKPRQFKLGPQGAMMIPFLLSVPDAGMFLRNDSLMVDPILGTELPEDLVSSYLQSTSSLDLTTAKESNVSSQIQL